MSSTEHTGPGPSSPADYQVGYRKPPKHTRFKPGQSGNDRGRPRRQRPVHLRQVRTDFFSAAHQLVTIKLDGQTRRITRIQALFEVEFAHALKGHSPSRKRLLDMYVAFSAEHEKWQMHFAELMLNADKYEEQEASKHQLTWAQDDQDTGLTKD